MKKLIQVSVSDFKLVFRDPSLRVFLVLPFLIFAVINFLLPLIVSKWEIVSDYVPYILVMATIETTQMFGFIYAMVFIEEKETEVARMYGILPVSKAGFVLFRMILPFLITVIFTFAILMLQPFYSLAFIPSLLFSFLAALIVPLYAIGVSILSKNKMEGMVWIKVFNLLVIIPAAAFFVPGIFSHLFGIFPTYWAFQSLYDIILGEPFALNLLIGVVFTAALLGIAVRRFTRTHFV